MHSGFVRAGDKWYTSTQYIIKCYSFGPSTHNPTSMGRRINYRFATKYSKEGVRQRRAHKKSRAGCETCKRRRIKCSEVFPQCLECTRHKVECSYKVSKLPDTPTLPIQESSTPLSPLLNEKYPPESVIHSMCEASKISHPVQSLAPLTHVFPTPPEDYLSMSVFDVYIPPSNLFTDISTEQI